MSEGQTLLWQTTWHIGRVRSCVFTGIIDAQQNQALALYWNVGWSHFGSYQGNRNKQDNGQHPWIFWHVIVYVCWGGGFLMIAHIGEGRGGEGRTNKKLWQDADSGIWWADVIKCRSYFVNHPILSTKLMILKRLVGIYMNGNLEIG